MEYHVLILTNARHPEYARNHAIMSLERLR